MVNQKSGLDQLILRLKTAFGVTMVVVTHELQSAFHIADRVALLHEGRFLVIDTPEVVRQSDDPIVRRFLDRQPPPPEDGASKFRGFLEELT